MTVRGASADMPMDGNSLDSLFVLKHARSRRASSFDRSGGNHDWMDLEPGETKDIADIRGEGIIRHIWSTVWVGEAGGPPESQYLRKLVLRMYWDGEKEPSVEAPLGDFFGMGHGLTRNFAAGPLAMSPQDGRAFNCFFPMPFDSRARITIENGCESHANFYFYVDYEETRLPAADCGRFHAQWRREADTAGWAPKTPGILDREKANVPGEPPWLPAAWLRKNTTGADNYVILDARGRGKYVGCNLNIDVFDRQANDWYGEGDDMIFIDGESWPPSLHGTGTEDYFNTAFCPSQEFCTPWHGITLYSGDQAGFRWGGKNSLYRYHINDPVHFEKSILVTIEHGHANKLSNDYSSTAYWYQAEPHAPFPPLPPVEGRVARRNPWETE
jgi:hypothetical protein